MCAMERRARCRLFSTLWLCYCWRRRADDQNGADAARPCRWRRSPACLVGTFTGRTRCLRSCSKRQMAWVCQSRTAC
uniref:Secreted protein n=1 Tax=Chlamydomonas sp. HS-5 TaxID=108458 RepID=Q9XFV9_9CHLO|nr:hypothetical protein [Chlamydomonas sp. HS-5]